MKKSSLGLSWEVRWEEKVKGRLPGGRLEDQWQGGLRRSLAPEVNGEEEAVGLDPR